MKILQKYTVIIPLFLFVIQPQNGVSQNYELNPRESKVIVYGTSNLHDWTVTSNEFNGSITFNNLTSCDIKNLKVEVPSTSLKSGKKGMDKNTYKALKTDDFSSIKFQLTKVKSANKNEYNSNKINASGSLTIIGNTNNLNVEFITSTTDNSICIEGFSIIKMTDFGVEPPKALFGTITTGDEIKIEYKLIFKTK